MFARFNALIQQIFPSLFQQLHTILPFQLIDLFQQDSLIEAIQMQPTVTPFEASMHSTRASRSPSLDTIHGELDVESQQLHDAAGYDGESIDLEAQVRGTSNGSNVRRFGTHQHAILYHGIIIIIFILVHLAQSFYVTSSLTSAKGGACTWLRLLRTHSRKPKEEMQIYIELKILPESMDKSYIK